MNHISSFMERKQIAFDSFIELAESNYNKLKIYIKIDNLQTFRK